MAKNNAAFHKRQWAVFSRMIGHEISLNVGNPAELIEVIHGAAKIALIFEADNRAFRRMIFFMSCVKSSGIQDAFGLNEEEFSAVRVKLQASFLDEINATESADYPAKDIVATIVKAAE